MLKINSFVMFIQLGLGFSCWAQDTINLNWCLDKTVQNHQRSSDASTIESILENKIRNIRSGNLPQLELNGKASYQSDAITIDVNIPLPGIELPRSPRDQYKVSVDITQSLYDGGLAKSKQKIEEVSTKVEKSQLEMEIRLSKMQVKDLYYSVLLIQKNQEVIDISMDHLLRNRRVVEAGIKSGIFLPSDLELLDVEVIKLKQRSKELENSRVATMQVLSNKSGEPIPITAILKPTTFEIPGMDTIQRLEQQLFDLQSDQLAKNTSLIKSRTLPKLYAFGQFGYGNPALNMLKDEFDTYYVVGAGLKWTIWDWNNNQRDMKTLSLQQSIVENRKKQFESDILSAIINQKATIKNHTENVLAYESILRLRNSITSTAKTQLEQGTIRTLDYITVFNQEILARIQFENEKTLLQQAIAKYLEIIGEL